MSAVREGYPLRSLIFAFALLSLGACKGYGSNKNLSEFTDGEMSALCDYAYQLRGGSSRLQKCESDDGTAVDVVLDVETAELSRCVGMPRPACPAYHFEACTEEIAKDPCTGAASQACLDWSDFCQIEED